MKMVIVMRTDLNMRKGKMVVQGAHAAVYSTINHTSYLTRHTPEAISRVRIFSEWIEKGQKKICVGVGSLHDLDCLIDNSIAADILCYPVTDAGLTEFNGVPTRTCIALGPDEDEKIDKITGHLKLL